MGHSCWVGGWVWGGLLELSTLPIYSFFPPRTRDLPEISCTDHPTHPAPSLPAQCPVCSSFGRGQNFLIVAHAKRVGPGLVRTRWGGGRSFLWGADLSHLCAATVLHPWPGHADDPRAFARSAPSRSRLLHPPGHTCIHKESPMQALFPHTHCRSRFSPTLTIPLCM